MDISGLLVEAGAIVVVLPFGIHNTIVVGSFVDVRMLYTMFVFVCLVSFSRFGHEACVASQRRVHGNRARIVHIPIFVSVSVFVVITMIVVVFHHRVKVVELEVFFVRAVCTIPMVEPWIVIGSIVIVWVISQRIGTCVSLAVFRLVVVTATCINVGWSIAWFFVLVLLDVAGCQCCIVEWSHTVAIDVKV